MKPHIKDFYDKKRSLDKSDVIRMGKMIQMVGKHKRVLDLGCGAGLFGKKLIEQGNEVYGIDFAPKAVKDARIKGVKAKCGDLTKKLPFNNKYFDVVTAGEVIEHVVDTGFFLDEINRVLKKKRTLVLSTPNIVSFGRRILTIIGKNAYFEPSFDHPWKGHVRYFTKDSLDWLLKQHGFKVTDYKSDLVSFVGNQKISSRVLATLVPSFGRSLIMKCKKQ